MVEQEVLAGLKNALDRGQPLEKAIQSLINAGYNSQEVRQTAQEASNSIIHHLPEESNQQINPEKVKRGFFSKKPQEQKVVEIQETPKPTNTNINNNNNKSNSETNTIQEKKPKRKLSRALVILLTVLGVLIVVTVGFMLFGKIILDLLFPK